MCVACLILFMQKELSYCHPILHVTFGSRLHNELLRRMSCLPYYKCDNGCIATIVDHTTREWLLRSLLFIPSWLWYSQWLNVYAAGSYLLTKTRHKTKSFIVLYQLRDMINQELL